jgi:hypothetical protein
MIMKALDIEGLCPNGVWVRLFRVPLLDELVHATAEKTMDKLSLELRVMKTDCSFGNEMQSISFNPSTFLAIRCSLVGF